MEVLRPDIDWHDTDRVNVLYGPFQNRNLNPDAWTAKINFWVETIEKWLCKEKLSSFTFEKLETGLSYKGKRPHCLRDVFQYMINEKKAVIKQQDLETKWSIARSSSWSSWTMNVLKSSVSGLVMKVVGTTEEPVQQDVFIHLARLEDSSKNFLANIRADKNCVKINKVVFLNRDCLDTLENVSLTEKDLMLKFLQANNLCDVQALSDGKVFVKIVDKNLGQNVTFTKQEIDTLRLRSCSEELTASIDDMEKEIEDLRMKAKLALREKSRTKAKQHLRRSKLLESQTDKKRILLDNIDQILLSIENASTNAEVTKSYSVGLGLIKAQLGSMKNVDETHDLMDEIHDLISEGEAISEAVGAMDTTSADDQDLLDELDKLIAADDITDKLDHLKQKEKEKRDEQNLLDRLNRLGVADKNPGTSVQGSDLSSLPSPPKQQKLPDLGF